MVWCFTFLTKHYYGNIILFFKFLQSFFVNRKFGIFYIKLCCKCSIIPIFAGFLFTRFKYLTKQRLKLSFSSFWILINPLVQLLSHKRSAIVGHPKTAFKLRKSMKQSTMIMQGTGTAGTVEKPNTYDRISYYRTPKNCYKLIKGYKTIRNYYSKTK